MSSLMGSGRRSATAWTAPRRPTLPAMRLAIDPGELRRGTATGWCCAGCPSCWAA